MLEHKGYVALLFEKQKQSNWLLFESAVIIISAGVVGFVLPAKSSWWLLLPLVFCAVWLFILRKRLPRVYEVENHQSGQRIYFHVQSGFFTELGQPEAEMYETFLRKQHGAYSRISLEEWQKIRDG